MANFSDIIRSGNWHPIGVPFRMTMYVPTINSARMRPTSKLQKQYSSTIALNWTSGPQTKPIFASPPALYAQAAAARRAAAHCVRPSDTPTSRLAIQNCIKCTHYSRRRSRAARGRRQRAAQAHALRRTRVRARQARAFSSCSHGIRPAEHGRGRRGCRSQWRPVAQRRRCHGPKQEPGRPDAAGEQRVFARGARVPAQRESRRGARVPQEAAAQPGRTAGRCGGGAPVAPLSDYALPVLDAAEAIFHSV